MPILTLFLFGIVQFGIAYDKQQSINSAAREGARLSALPTTTLAQASDRAVGAANIAATSNSGIRVVLRDDANNVHGTRNPNGTYVGSSTSSLAMPCGEAANSDGDASTPPSQYVRVEVMVPHDLTIPFFGVYALEINAEAEFRCER